MIRMSHQQRAESWSSFAHTLKDLFIMMQEKEMFDALNKKNT